jgi:hypothetical protein
MKIPFNLSEQKYFILACFADDLQEFYREWVNQKKDRIQFFEEFRLPVYEHKYWMPSKICCESGEVLTEDNISIKVGYWTPHLWKPINKDLLQEAKKLEAYECQKIDCSCSDCISFKRETGDKGECLKFNKKITAWPNTACPQNLRCFKHRLDK